VSSESSVVLAHHPEMLFPERRVNRLRVSL
jgi:hypothetical protein